MGELNPFSLSPNGIPLDLELFPIPDLPSNVPLTNPDPDSINDYCWLIAETKIASIINQIHPTVRSDKRRKAIINYIKRILGANLGIQVFPYGSVPLKTYLPDGDIDLTAVSARNLDEKTLADDIMKVLKREAENKAAEFEVRDVQYIGAEVKLVKCLVQNIVVDISVNQTGGICTLCFLDQVNHIVAKENLFKRSIILIKAWCYYESRILGAHHALLSTYALETLVLYIFHVFYSSLDGPLAVLYRFLDYFSKFDCDNYCISLNGPAPITSLPEIVAEAPENGGSDLLITRELLRYFKSLYTGAGIKAESRSFPLKFLNIIDPLKNDNNLGRSVSKGNCYRIRSAFTYGARSLGQILTLSGMKMTDELDKFFSNTMERHGSLERKELVSNKRLDQTPSYYYHEDTSVLNRKAMSNGYRDDYTGTDGRPGGPNSLADLTGEFEMNFNNLMCWRGQNGFRVGGSVLPLPPIPAPATPPPPPPHRRNRPNWVINGHFRSNRNTYPHQNTRSVSSGVLLCSASSPKMQCAVFSTEEIPKPRGTGTFLPNMQEYNSWRDNSSYPMKGRNPALMNHRHYLTSPRESGWDVIPNQMFGIGGSSSRSGELQPRHIYGSGTVDVFHNAGPVPREIPHSNGFSPTENLEFGTYRQPPMRSTPSPDISRQPEEVNRQPPDRSRQSADTSRQAASSSAQTSVSTSTVQKSGPPMDTEKEKASSSQAYHMKDDDFPPLSS